MKYFCSLLFCLCLAGSLQAQARLYSQHKVKISYYPVSGSNPAEWQQIMHQRGPFAADNRRHFAYTLWSFRIGTRKQPKQQIEKKPDLKCLVSVQLPHLKKTRQNQHLLRIWDDFYMQLVKHESVHVKHAARACLSLIRHKAGQQYLNALAKRIKSRDSMLDISTRHGVLAGVKLPDHNADLH